jgi:hypothetical protein
LEVERLAYLVQVMIGELVDVHSGVRAQTLKIGLKGWRLHETSYSPDARCHVGILVAQMTMNGTRLNYILTVDTVVWQSTTSIIGEGNGVW